MAMNPVSLRQATAADWPDVAALLQAHQLPLAGAQAHLPAFMLAVCGAETVGVGGLEVHGDVALLRSVAVVPERHARGIGRALVGVLLGEARRRGIRQVFLLTTTAADYFGRFGFAPVPRDEAPAPLQASAEFQGACPASAALMQLAIGHPAVNLRVATPDDAEAITAIYAPIVADTAISFELEPPSVEEMRSRIAGTLQRLPWLVSLDAEGRVNGYAYASKHRERAAYQWAVDTSAYVREDSRGQGVGRRLYAALFEELVKLGYYQAFAGIALPNAGSVGLHEAVGFVALGVYRDVGFKFGAWRDVGWWQKTLQAPAGAPPVPKLFAGG